MQVFIGTKMIKARPMTRGEYNVYRDWPVPENENPHDPGYLVEYIDGGAPNDRRHDGYISWSPKHVFENAYTVIPLRTDLPQYALRVAAEKAQLDERIEKLAEFLHTEKFRSLPSAEKEDLTTQLTLMRGYSERLSKRLARAEKDKGVAAA